jgi:hypothetical protein
MIDLQGLNLSAAQIEKIEVMIKDAQKKPFYPYPWDFLEEELKGKGLSGVPVVGYGSLINIRSAAQTLSEESLEDRKPVITFGVHRLFNYKMPENISYSRSPKDTAEQAALNVLLTGCVYDVVNGVLINMLLKDIHSIRKREIGYDLVPVVCIQWGKTEIKPFPAYIFSCPEGTLGENRLTGDKTLPNHEYYLKCRKGAEELGKEFLRFWLLTTYLADRVTTVAQWESAELPELDLK